MVCGLGGGRVPVPIRLLASNPTGYAVRVETYFEASVCSRMCKEAFWSGEGVEY